MSGLLPLSLLVNKILQHLPLIGKLNMIDLLNQASDSMALIYSANRKVNLKRRRTVKLGLQFQ